MNGYSLHLQVPVTRLHEGYSLHQPVSNKSFDGSELYFNRLPNRSRGESENNLLRSFSADKERANSVAKIKVVVRVFGPYKHCSNSLLCNYLSFLKIMRLGASTEGTQLCWL